MNLNRAGLMGLGGAVAGLVLHLGLFIRGEWHVYAPEILVAHLLVFASSFLASLYFGTIQQFAQDSAILSICYCSSLFASIAVYRLVFHRLTRLGYPGPTGARLTKLWHVWASRKSKNHLVLEELHKKYGDFVRSGPSEITIFHPDVFWAIDGPKTECIKSEWYDLLNPNISLVTSRTKFSHQTRRRQWNRGFSTKAITQYEEKILKYLDELDDCIEADAEAGRISNVTNLFYWFGFDAMGDFVFNKSFGMLKDQEWHYIVLLLQSALSFLGPFSPVPWFVQIGFRLTPRFGVVKDWFDMEAWCQIQMQERIDAPEDKIREPDVAHYLIEDAKSTGYQKESWRWLNGDSLLAIVAGSEPTASALIGLFCELAKNPIHAQKIYEEVLNVDIYDVKALSKLPHLEACIIETLRLYPALPTGGNRKTTEGITIAGKYIPPQTTIVAPRYTISRREDCFERGNEFIPERWYAKPEMVRNKNAYAPFGTGHHSCLGRVLATDDMRLVTARLVKKYVASFAPGDNGDRVALDLKDQFTSNPGVLNLMFKARNKV